MRYMAVVNFLKTGGWKYVNLQMEIPATAD